MSRFSQTVFIVVALIIVSIATTEANQLKCFTCMACELGKETAKICTVDTKTETKEGEEETEWWCYNMMHDMKANGNAEERMRHDARGCTQVANFCDNQEECTLCQEDECNSASNLAVSSLIIASSLLLAKFW